MKNIILYEADLKREIMLQVNAYHFKDPITNKNKYLVEYNDTSIVVNEEELIDEGYFKSRKKAQGAIDKSQKKEEDFKNICIDFINKCKYYQEENPFIRIGRHEIEKQNLITINTISDSVFNLFLKQNLFTPSNLSDLEKIIVKEINK